jgi:serine protease
MAAILAAFSISWESTPAQAQASTSRTPQLIVKFRAAGERAALGARERVALLASDTGIPLVHQRSMAFGLEVVTTFRALTVDEARAEAAVVAVHPDVEVAEPDYLRHIDEPTRQTIVPGPAPEQTPLVQKLMPNDQLLQFQTYLDDSPGGINAFAAWDVTTGSPTTVIAIVDTGVTHHADLAARIVGGYNFISNPIIANGGPTRGPDFYDYGNWVTADDLTDPALQALITQYDLTCPVMSSEWHGTAVAGIIAATANNGLFLAGLNWVSLIVIARTYGKCGDGFDSDALDGLAWAAGLSVPGVPDNPNPAQIINLSAVADLAQGCNALWQNAVDQIFAHGVTRAFVAGAGNSSVDVAERTPASCNGVIAVAATNRGGGLASYSDSGAGITIAAPGGDVTDNLYHGLSLQAADIAFLWDSGATVPAGDSWNYGEGTSFATPMVSGVISLMLAVAPNLTPAQIVSILKASAKPFPMAPPWATQCTTAICGAGILDAHAAVVAAQAAANAQPNYQGLWFAAPAYSESGWGINFAHQGNIIFASWFTYDLTGKGMWLVMTAQQTAPNTYAGTLYSTKGPAFNAVPFDPAKVVPTAVGNGTLTFTDANDGTFSYTVNGIAQNKAITREVFGPLPTCATVASSASLVAATNYQDLWWAAPAYSESGWGINLNHEGDIIFATWFTYDLDGSPMWLVVQANKSAPGVYTGTLYRTTGPAFNAVPFVPAKVVATAVGTATLTFADGNDATFAYTVNGVSQQKAITREVFSGTGTVCQ